MRAYIILPILAACTPPVEAPAELGDLTLYFFQNFNAEGEELAVGASSLEEYLLGLDLEGDVDGRAVTLPQLTEEYLGDVSGPAGMDTSLQVPVAVSGISANDLDAALGLMTDTNQVCIASNSYKYYDRQFDTDSSCFVDGSCSTISSTNTIRYESILANVWFWETQDFRRVDLDDGRTVVFKRGVMSEEFPSDNGSATWMQRFGMDIFMPEAGDTGRIYRFLAFWSAVDLPGIGDDTYSNLVKNGIEEGFDNEDAFTAGEECSNDRDAEYEPPF